MATASPSSSQLGVEVDLFVDRLSAEPFVCPICHFVVSDALEHIPTDNQDRCPYIFCRPCAQQWIDSRKGGVIPCPSGFCSDSGFSMLNLRPLSVRERNRLRFLLVKCQFGCSEEIAHEDYHLHLKKCKDNPMNICRICKVYKSDEHDCGLMVESLRDRIKELEEENERVSVIKEFGDRKLEERIKELEGEIERVRVTKEFGERKLEDRIKELEEEIERVKLINMDIEKQKLVQVYAETVITQLDSSSDTSPEVSPRPSRSSSRQSSSSSSRMSSRALSEVSTRSLATRAYGGGYMKDADSDRNPLISFELYDTLEISDESILKQLKTRNNINVAEVRLKAKFNFTIGDGKHITKVILALTREQRLRLGPRPVFYIENKRINVWDDFDVPHCAYCLKLDHIQKQCVNRLNNLPRTCRKCLMAHGGTCLPGTVIPFRFCQTCKMVSNINAEHRSQSLQCEHFRQRVLKKLPKINFDYSVFPSIQQQLYGHQYS